MEIPVRCLHPKYAPPSRAPTEIVTHEDMDGFASAVLAIYKLFTEAELGGLTVAVKCGKKPVFQPYDYNRAKLVVLDMMPEEVPPGTKSMCVVDHHPHPPIHLLSVPNVKVKWVPTAPSTASILYSMLGESGNIPSFIRLLVQTANKAEKGERLPAWAEGLLSLLDPESFPKIVGEVLKRCDVFWLKDAADRKLPIDKVEVVAEIGDFAVTFLPKDVICRKTSYLMFRLRQELNKAVILVHPVKRGIIISARSSRKPIRKVLLEPLYRELRKRGYHCYLTSGGQGAGTIVVEDVPESICDKLLKLIIAQVRSIER